LNQSNHFETMFYLQHIVKQRKLKLSKERGSLDSDQCAVDIRLACKFPAFLLVIAVSENAGNLPANPILTGQMESLETQHVTYNQSPMINNGIGYGDDRSSTRK